MKFFESFGAKKSVVRQLLVRVLSLYLIVALVLFVLDVVIQYYNVKREVTQELYQIHKSFAPGLAQALWDVNADQVQSFFDGMVKLPSVVGGEVQDELGKTICVGGLVLDSSGMTMLIEGESRMPKPHWWGEIFLFSEPITFMDGDVPQKVGHVVLYSSSDVVLQRLMLGVGLTLIQVFFAAGALCLIFVWFFKRLLSRPLGILTSAVEGLDVDRIEDFQVDVHASGNNELKVLEASFNNMAQNLAKDRAKLIQFRADLEKQIEARTVELQEKAETESGFAELTSQLQGNLSPDQIAETALLFMVEHLDAPSGALYVFEKEGQLHRRAQYALPPESEKETSFLLGSGSIGHVGQCREMQILSPDDQTWSVTFGLGKAPPHHVVTCPLVSGNTLAGVVELYMFKAFNGTHSQWLNKASEITAAALRLAQEGLEKAQADERIRLILESTPDSMVITNAQGEIVMTNAMAEKTFGYDRGDLVGRPVTDLIPDRFQDGHDDHVAGFVKNPHLREMGKGYDLFAVRKDRSEFPIEISLNPIETLDELLIVAAVRDITEHKAERARLRKLSRATEQSPALVVITDRDGIIEYVNPKFTEVTGYTFEEAVGQTPRMLKSGRQSTEFYKNLWDTILAGEEWHGEFCNRRKNGEEYWERASVSPIRDDKGDVSHFVAVKEDITERKLRRNRGGTNES